VYSVIGEMCTRVCVWGGGGIDSSGRLVECGSLNKRIGSDRIDVRRSVAVDCEWRCQLELKSGRSLIVWEWSFREWFGGCWCVDKRVLQPWQPSWGPGARQVVDGLLTWTAVSGCNSGSCRREVIYWTPSSRFRCSLGRDGGRAHSSTTLGCGPGGLCGVHHRANHNAHGNLEDTHTERHTAPPSLASVGLHSGTPAFERREWHFTYHAHDNERCDFSLCHSICSDRECRRRH
jgi:hypothetical protein